MLGINLTRPVATLAVVAGLLAVAGSASAAQTEEPIAPPPTELNLLGYEELEWNVVSQAGPHAGAGNDRPNRTQAGILDGSSNTLETGLLGSASDIAEGSSAVYVGGLDAPIPLSAALVKPGQKALGTRAGGEVVGFFDMPAELASLRASGVSRPVAPVEATALQEATQMERRRYGRADALSPEHRVQYRGRVIVADGNGATAATFATTLAGDDVRYVFVLDTDCNRARCRPPVEELDVSLDNDLVLHATELDAIARHDIALNAIRADENPITITATGTPGAGARIGVHAFRTPARTAPDLPVHTASDAAAA